MADSSFGLFSTNALNMPSTSTQNSASSSTGMSSCAFSSILSETLDTGKAKKSANNSPCTITTGDFEKEEDAKRKTAQEESKNLINLTGRLINVDDWVNVPEFIPRTAQITDVIPVFSNLSVDDEKSKKKLCPYAERDGLCKYPTGECTYLHGDMCDLCTRPALHPYNEELRKKHTQECIQQHERDMEISFAIARSNEKVCGICFETVMQKTSPEQCFGILPNCNHCFCLSCIRRWRQAKQFENKIIRACPECRVTSDFVCPSTYWVDTKEEKDRVIVAYKENLARKDCKYFKQGRGSCPFGNKCFYNHALPDGRKIDVGPPPSLRTIIELPQDMELIQRLLVLGIFQDRCPLDNIPDDFDLEEIVNMVELSEVFSDTDDSVFLSDGDLECWEEN